MLVAAGLAPECLLVRDAARPGWKRGLEAVAAVVCDAAIARRCLLAVTPSSSVSSANRRLPISAPAKKRSWPRRATSALSILSHSADRPISTLPNIAGHERPCDSLTGLRLCLQRLGAGLARQPCTCTSARCRVGPVAGSPSTASRSSSTTSMARRSAGSSRRSSTGLLVLQPARESCRRGFSLDHADVLGVDLDLPRATAFQASRPERNYHPAWISSMIAGGIIVGLVASKNTDAGTAAEDGIIGAGVVGLIGAPLAFLPHPQLMPSGPAYPQYRTRPSIQEPDTSAPSRDAHLLAFSLNNHITVRGVTMVRKTLQSALCLLFSPLLIAQQTIPAGACQPKAHGPIVLKKEERM